MKNIYLDYAATTPVVPEVVDAVMDCIKNEFGNPSSLHRLGIQAEKRIKEVKGEISRLIKVDAEEIYFTSGGTEANNLCILGCASERHRDGKHCITTSIEHPSVLAAFGYLEKQGYEVTYLPVNTQGVIDQRQLMEALRPDTILISIMHVNNEIGSIHPIEQVGKILGTLKKKPIFHVDAIQSIGKIPLRPREWGVDLMSFSGHKIHALKGIGAVYKKKTVRLQPVQWGGGQEGGLRSGTQNIPGIVSMGSAVKWISRHLSEDDQTLYKIKASLISKVRSAFPNVIINGPDPGNAAPHIVNISFTGLRGEVLLHTLEDKGVFISTGSACSSKSKKSSHILNAIGLDPKIAEGAIRISLSYTTTDEEITEFISLLKESVREIERYTRR